MFGRKRKASDFSDEVRSHIEIETQRLREQGLSEAEARARAQQTFGNVTRAEEHFYESRRWLFWDTLARDIRFSLRVLRKSPGFTSIAVITLAVAIGANAVVFGVLNTLILKPLNVPDQQSLYEIKRADTIFPYQSYPDYLDLRDQNRSFDGLAAFSFAEAGVDTDGNPSRSWVYEVTGNYFDSLQIQPYLGRLLHASDEHGTNSAPYVVLSYGYWHAHFHEDASVVGRTIQVNKHPFTIIGVTPPDFQGTVLFFSPDFFASILNSEQVDGTPSTLNVRSARTVFMTIGHLKRGVTPAQATADLNSTGAYLEKTYPKDDGKMSFALARPSLIGDVLGPPIRAFMAGLMLLAGLILLAACANLGSLFAARAADRSREMALRLALGARRLQILRQVFTEALLISAAGGAVGLWASILLLRALANWQPFPRFPVHLALNADANVYAMALLLAIVSGFLFGAVPVRQVLRTDPYEIVKSGSRATAGRRITARDALLVAQISICAVLITSSFVAVRGLIRSMHGNFGFEPQNAMLVEAELHMAGYSGDEMQTMRKRLIAAVQAIPGVQSAALISIPPLDGAAGSTLVFKDDTADLRPGNAAASPFLFAASPGYLEAAGTTLLEGRSFTWHDDSNSPRVAMVNPVFARKVFGSEAKALGAYFKRRDGTRLQVVGVVEQGKYGRLTEQPAAALFLPILQSIETDSYVVVRSSRNAQQLGPALRGAIREVDPELPLLIQTWDQDLNIALFGPRMATMSLGVLGAMGAMLSITGVFGMAAYSVSKRKRELGIRIALGAQRKELLQAALGRAFKLLAIGSVAGLALGLLATRVLALIVYQASPRDPVVLTGAVLAMLLLGLLATWIPARRALSVDPLILMREE